MVIQSVCMSTTVCWYATTETSISGHPTASFSFWIRSVLLISMIHIVCSKKSGKSTFLLISYLWAEMFSTRPQDQDWYFRSWDLTSLSVCAKNYYIQPKCLKDRSKSVRWPDFLAHAVDCIVFARVFILRCLIELACCQHTECIRQLRCKVLTLPNEM